jgi:hypothetical protein
MKDTTGTEDVAWVCDVCKEPAGRMVFKPNGDSYARHLRCEPKKTRGPKLDFRGLGWARHGYHKELL